MNKDKVSESMPVRVTWVELQHFDDGYRGRDQNVSLCKRFNFLADAEEFCKSKLESGIKVQRMAIQLIVVEADTMTKLGMNLMTSGRSENV